MIYAGRINSIVDTFEVSLKRTRCTVACSSEQDRGPRAVGATEGDLIPPEPSADRLGCTVHLARARFLEKHPVFVLPKAVVPEDILAGVLGA